MRRITAVLVLLLAVLLLAAGAAGARDVYVPPPLQPWQQWVLYGHEDNSCTSVWHNGKQHRCRWPGELIIAANDSGASFEQFWHLDRPGWIVLPGDERHWPQQVSVDGEAAAIMRSSALRQTRPRPRTGGKGATTTMAPPRRGSTPANRPQVWVAAGDHLVSGKFIWPLLPEKLAIDSHTALIKLTRRGSFVANPRRDADGTLWLKRDNNSSAVTEQDRVRLRVFRLIDDNIPLRLTTHLKLQVSGRARLLKTATVLPPQFFPLRLNSPLPARLEKDGRLSIQLKPGNWDIEISARHSGQVDILTMPKPDGPWATEEVWSVRSHPELRVISIEADNAIDPAQTAMPQQWRRHPAYLLTPGATVKLVPRRRGNTAAAAQLRLRRTLWLDMDGSGYTVKDNISGTGGSSARLQAGKLLQPGRASVNGKDSFITRLDKNSPPGIELRRQQNDIEVDSRLEGVTSALPAVGWQFNPQSLHTSVNLPPGWRLLAASGPDRVSSSWIRDWSLLDIFIVLVLALGFWRIWGMPVGIIALTGLALTWHEAGAPHLLWLNALIPVALLRLLPEGRFKQLTGYYRNIALLLLLLPGLSFATQQIRSAVYPQLEPLPALHHHISAKVADEAIMLSNSVGKRKMIAVRSSAASPPPRIISNYDTDLKIQTGPGVPDWQWRQFDLNWNGPVSQTEQLHLYLLPPTATRALLCVGVVLLGLMFVRLLGGGPLPRWRRPEKSATATGTTTTAILLLVAMVSAPLTLRAEMPSPELLQQLQQRLLAQPECAPDCAALNRLEINADLQRLRLVLDVHCQIDSAIPLPLNPRQLHLRTLQLDDGEQAPLYRDRRGVLWARVGAGRHRLVIHADIPAGIQRLQLPMNMTAGTVKLQTGGWSASGINNGESSRGPIELTRRAKSGGKQLQAGEMPPFIEVTRELRFDLDWQVHTTVRRLSQNNSALLVKVALLPGERVTSANTVVKDHKVLVSMPSGSNSFSWHSSLEKTGQIELLAATGEKLREIWQVAASPMWRVSGHGLPVINYYQHGRWLPQWQPWPGEKLTLDITRPGGAAGQTVTIDNSNIGVTPGKRSCRVTLDMLVRSSHGGEHVITLPPGAKLRRVAINGQKQPVKLKQLLLTVPLAPGAQHIELEWQQPQHIGMVTATPAVHLGGNSVNCRINVNMPRERWILFTRGPVMGPAVLFWGVLLVIAVIAVLLGRYADTPLVWWHWLLLFAGLSQASLPALVPVAAWLILLGLRRKHQAGLTGVWRFNCTQMALVLLSVLALGAIVFGIQQGLLGLPQMQISGNHSSTWHLHWYQDRCAGFIPAAQIISVPMYIYRLLMLLWALWLALALLKWLQWGWECFSSGGLWRKPPPRAPRAKPVRHQQQPSEPKG